VVCCQPQQEERVLPDQMQHDGMDKVKKLHGKLCWLQLKTKLTEENAESKNLRENCNAKIDTAIHLVDALWNLIL
jgi:hypothetical protein